MTLPLDPTAEQPNQRPVSPGVTEGRQPSISAPRRRPFTVTLLALGVLMFAWLNTVRLALSISQWRFLGSLAVAPLYIAGSGLLWGLAWLVLFWGLWRGLGWAWRGVQVAAPLYALYVWMDRILPGLRYQSIAGAMPSNWPFLLVLTGVLLAYVLLVLMLPKTRAFLGRS
jgi:hypothetical protein